MKKAISLVLVLILIAGAFAGCAITMQQKLIGTWVGSKDLMILEAKYTYTFNEDGTGKLSTPGLDLGVSMNYTLDGDQLTITYSVLGISKSDTYTVEFDGDNLLLTTGGDTITLTREAEE